MPNEIQNVSATALPDVQGMIEQLMRLIPGMMVTVAGGVVTSMLPGKIKIAGLPIVGYGMFMVMNALQPTWSVKLQPEPTYPTQVMMGENFQINYWVHNATSEVLNVRSRIIDRDTDEELRFDGPVEMNPDQGRNVISTFTMLGPAKVVHLKLECGVVDDAGTFTRTDFRDIDIECPNCEGGVEPSAEITNIMVSSTQLQPGDTQKIYANIKNTGTVASTFYVGVSIGRSTNEDDTPEGEWHDTDIYNDGKGDILTVNLEPNQSISIDRSFYIDPNLNPENWNDVWVGVRKDPADTNYLDWLDSEFLYNAFSVKPAVRKVFGYVRDALLGLPIQIASVEIDDMLDYTDSDGYYEILDPHWSGYVNITASVTGYISQTKEILLPGDGEQLQVDFDLQQGSADVTADIEDFEVNGV